jgi:hypothetical protein
MHSRIKQLFVWKDLWHYPEDYPFYLNVYNPGALESKRAGSSSLSSVVPVRANIQSYRDKKWWTYVVTSGSAATTVSVGVSRGTLSYSTTINSLKINSQYGPEYARRYNKGKAKLPDDIVAKAITGPQSGLSGAMRFPNVDLDEAGEYRASSFKWVGSDTFTVGFASLK